MCVSGILVWARIAGTDCSIAKEWVLVYVYLVSVASPSASSLYEPVRYSCCSSSSCSTTSEAVAGVMLMINCVFCNK